MSVENFLNELKKLRIVLKQLNPTEKKVLKYRWGFYVYEIQALERVGEKINRSRERTRQIEKNIKKKLQKAIDIMKG